MATLTRGYSFGATETVTNAKLHSLVDSGSVADLAQTDLAAGSGLVSVATSAPSDTDQVWVDTSVSPPVLKVYNSGTSTWVPASEYGVLTNKTGQTGALGRVVIIDTTNDNAYKYTSTGGDSKFLGIEFGATTANNAGAVVTRGARVPVLLEISASAGCYLKTSTATGKADPTALITTGNIFGVTLQSASANANANSHVFGLVTNNSVDVAANYAWTGTHSFTNTITINTASGTTVNWSPIVQIVSTNYTACATGTTALPVDNTTPGSAEGAAIMTQAITPKSAANKLIIDVLAQLAPAAGEKYAMTLFDGGNNLLAAVAGPQYAAPIPIYLFATASAGTTAATTFTVRAGTTSGGTLFFNAIEDGTALFNGKSASHIKITEVKG